MITITVEPGLQEIAARLVELQRKVEVWLPRIVQAAQPDIDKAWDEAVSRTVAAWRAAVPGSFRDALGGGSRVVVRGTVMTARAWFTVADARRPAYGGYVNRSAPGLRLKPYELFRREARGLRVATRDALHAAADSVIAGG